MIWDESAGEFIFLVQSSDHEITAAENGNFIRLCLLMGIRIPANSVILVMVGHYGGENEVEFITSQHVAEQSVLGYTSGETSPFILTEPSAIVARLNFSECYGEIIDPLSKKFSIQQNVPNPFNESTVISYELTEANDLHFEVTDAMGRVVYMEDYQNQSEGNHSITLTANQFAKGVYFYTFKIGSQTITNRMIVN